MHPPHTHTHPPPPKRRKKCKSHFFHAIADHSVIFLILLVKFVINHIRGLNKARWLKTLFVKETKAVPRALPHGGFSVTRNQPSEHTSESACLAQRDGDWLQNRRTAIRFRLGSPPSSKVVVYGHSLVTFTSHSSKHWTKLWWWHRTDRHNLPLPPPPGITTPASTSWETSRCATSLSTPTKQHMGFFFKKAGLSPTGRNDIITKLLKGRFCFVRTRWFIFNLESDMRRWRLSGLAVESTTKCPQLTKKRTPAASLAMDYIIIIIKRISRAPINYTRRQHRALYNNTNPPPPRPHAHTRMTRAHTHTHINRSMSLVFFIGRRKYVFFVLFFVVVFRAPNSFQANKQLPGKQTSSHFYPTRPGSISKLTSPRAEGLDCFRDSAVVR